MARTKKDGPEIGRAVARLRLSGLEIAALIAAPDTDNPHYLTARAKLVRAFVQTGGQVKDGLPSSHGGPDVPGVAR